jgi:integrase
MANKANHRRFGTVRKLSSGRYQARYPGPDGRLRPAPETYERKRDAERYLTMVEAEMVRDEWTDPEQVKITVRDYAERWIEERPNLRPRTLQLYRWTLKKHIVPYLGDVPIGKVTTPMVRRWRVQLAADGYSAGMVAKAYRLLRAVFWTAVREDELLRKNPCRIPAADQEHPEERPHLTLDQVIALREHFEPRYQMLILTAAMASLRFGEVTALRRRDFDVNAGSIRVERQFLEVTGKGLVASPVKKSAAGVRTVAVPREFVALLVEHIETYVKDTDADALLFTTPYKRPIRRGGFQKLTGWKQRVEKAGHKGLHFHDLRHTGNMLAAASGATVKDLMARMGHQSMAAALIYLHVNREADRRIADHIGAAMRTSLQPNVSDSDTKGEGDILGPA